MQRRLLWCAFTEVNSVDRVSISARNLDRPPKHRARGHRQTLLLFLACCVVGCGDATSATPCPATSVGPVGVSGGPNPTITWVAECGTQVVAVYDASTGIDVWHLTANTRSIAKPVVYGVVPVGAKALHAAEPLQSGMHYGVYVAVVVGTDTLASIGNFTP